MCKVRNRSWNLTGAGNTECCFDDEPGTIGDRERQCIGYAYHLIFKSLFKAAVEKSVHDIIQEDAWAACMTHCYLIQFDSSRKTLSKRTGLFARYLLPTSSPSSPTSFTTQSTANTLPPAAHTQYPASSSNHRQTVVQQTQYRLHHHHHYHHRHRHRRRYSVAPRCHHTTPSRSTVQTPPEALSFAQRRVYVFVPRQRFSSRTAARAATIPPHAKTS